MTTTVLDQAAGGAASIVEPGCGPAACRIGLLGLGNVGSAFARLTRSAGAALATRGFAPSVSVALVRSLGRPRPAAAFTNRITATAEDFFAEPVDVVVEALGGVEPAFSLVRHALDRGIPVITANKSLIAAHGEALSQVARRRGTALRFEASCIAGVPFLGMFERRPLGSAASGITAILNGTSNAILTAMAGGTPFAAALADAQRLGLAEPDPTMDISGADAAEKLTILLRLFGRLLVSPGSIPTAGIGAVEAGDIAAAAAFGGAIRPVSYASWHGDRVHAFVGPAFLGGSHALSRVSGVTNGIEIRSDAGSQAYIGPGAGPDVTAATLLDDVAEVVTERRVRTPSAASAVAARSVARPESAWFVRLDGPSRHADVGDLLGSYGIWCRGLARHGDRTFALTCTAGASRVAAALDALQAALGVTAAAFPALIEDHAPPAAGRAERGAAC
ncbi:MAG TPA: homoserine dehydrogenase [Vicinamibacterales bacterium]|nr:homoserine dehydrogenase [Vicinamibacterales bacterium]